uniref:Oxidoreductase n=1 Tax=Heterorhabditis bacteriophora TaxID=37862 RepID=A0A1I7WSQ2_HETBA
MAAHSAKGGTLVHYSFLTTGFATMNPDLHTDILDNPG